MSSNILTHRGYSGAVEFSAEDGCFFGKVLGIRDSVTFEGESVADLRKGFENAVDDYLEVCKEIVHRIALINTEGIPHRPGRVEPRVRKRRAKNYSLMTMPRHELKKMPPKYHY